MWLCWGSGPVKSWCSFLCPEAASSAQVPPSNSTVIGDSGLEAGLLICGFALFLLMAPARSHLPHICISTTATGFSHSVHRPLRPECCFCPSEMLSVCTATPKSPVTVSARAIARSGLHLKLPPSFPTTASPALPHLPSFRCLRVWISQTYLYIEHGVLCWIIVVQLFVTSRVVVTKWVFLTWPWWSRFYFLRVVLGLQINWKGGTEISHIPF